MNEQMRKMFAAALQTALDNTDTEALYLRDDDDVDNKVCTRQEAQEMFHLLQRGRMISKVAVTIKGYALVDHPITAGAPDVFVDSWAYSDDSLNKVEVHVEEESVKVVDGG